MIRQLNPTQQSKNLLFQIVDKSAAPVIVIDESQNIVTINDAAEILFGITRKEIFNQPVQTILTVQIRVGELSKTQTSNKYKERRQGHTYRVITGTHKSGEKILLHASLTPIPVDNGTAHLILLEDASANLMKNDFTTDHQRLQIIFELAPIGICQIDEKWNCVYANGNFCQLAGMNSDELLGRNWIDAIHIDDCGRILQKFRRSLTKGEEYNAEFRFQTPLGKISWVACTARALFGKNGGVIGYLCTFKDITDQHQAQCSLEFLAHYDPLTQLANRTLFLDRLNHAILRATRHGDIALLYLDLDGFKDINDSFGHDIGDLLLKQVAERLLRCVRKEDTIARLGGDEFTVLLENINDQIHVSYIAQNVIDCFKKPFYLSNRQIFVSTSIGVAVGLGAEYDSQTLIKQADIAMYSAKDSGRNTYKFFTPELNRNLESRLTLGNELHSAVETGGLTVYYQPQIDAASGIIIGAEALLRWPHPTKGFITPSKFIPILEERGLIDKVGSWVLDQTLRQKSIWNELHSTAKTISVSINVSAKQFGRDNICADLERAMEIHSIPADQIILEITESVLFKDGHFVGAVLKKLKNMGITISLDDFGTGYSSLSYLKRFPIDHIKIDQSFIKDIHVDSDNTAITNAIINLGHSLNMKVIAEGVDTYEKAQYLNKQGCDILQGYYFSKPVDAADMPWQFNWQPEKLLQTMV